MRSLVLRSPAKLNLYLRVLGSLPAGQAGRRDGYHELFTLFHRISLCDILRFRKAGKFSLRSSDPKLPAGERNLITRAYRELQKKFPHLGGVWVHLTKKIPVGGGLGGGSSNAATFLLGMKRMYDLKISQAELVGIGKRLGSDVPFFLSNINQAVGLGRGDEIKSRPAKHRQWFVLVLSKSGLSTQAVYEGLGRRFQAVSLTKLNRAVTLLYTLFETKKLNKVQFYLRNDLEIPAFKLRPSLRQIVASLKKMGVPAVQMSGSGPTVFGMVSNRAEAEKAARKLRPKLRSSQIVICHTF